jgi:hypothetical protein
MPNYIIFDPNSTPVTNIVTEVLRSFDEGKENTLPANHIKDPDLTGVVLSDPMRWTGSAVVNLTPAEEASVQAAVDSANLASLKQSAKDIFITPKGSQNQAIALGFATMRDMMLSEINLLRAATVPPLTARTLNQFNSTFKSTYEAKIDALS